MRRRNVPSPRNSSIPEKAEKASYVMALGYSGLGQKDIAERCYTKVREIDGNRQMYRE